VNLVKRLGRIGPGVALAGLVAACGSIDAHSETDLVAVQSACDSADRAVRALDAEIRSPNRTSSKVTNLTYIAVVMIHARISEAESLPTWTRRAIQEGALTDAAIVTETGLRFARQATGAAAPGDLTVWEAFIARHRANCRPWADELGP